MSTTALPRFIRWFADVSLDDIPFVGGKNASLGEMVRELGAQGIKVPNGFAVTADGYRHFMHSRGLDEQIKLILADLDTANMDNLQHRGNQVRHAILATAMPDDLEDEILEAYLHLNGIHAGPLDVAVRTSATAEDLPDASFAGQHETYLNVQGNTSLLEHCRRFFASAVKSMIAQVIRTCRGKNCSVGICGQAPSDYPDFAQFLVEQGIDSISLNPDTMAKTTLAVIQHEQPADAKISPRTIPRVPAKHGVASI